MLALKHANLNTQSIFRNLELTLFCFGHLYDECFFYKGLLPGLHILHSAMADASKGPFPIAGPQKVVPYYLIGIPKWIYHILEQNIYNTFFHSYMT